jgi:flagellar biogenesis protein FliO
MDIYVGIIKVFLLMLGMVAAIIFFARYAKKIKFLPGSQNAGYGLKKAGSIYLGYKKFVAVVEVQDRVLVIGAGDKEMSLLTSWKKGEKEEGQS